MNKFFQLPDRVAAELVDCFRIDLGQTGRVAQTLKDFELAGAPSLRFSQGWGF
jgi:hypothetical protein